MSGGSAAWRAHVDAALDPRFERAFAILDAVHAERQRPRAEQRASRVLGLRRELDHLLAELDGQRRSRVPRGTR